MKHDLRPVGHVHPRHERDHYFPAKKGINNLCKFFITNNFMRINKLSLNYIVFTYLRTRWISRISCSIPRQYSIAFNNGVKALFEAKLHVFRNGKFFEPIGLHICMMSLILHFLPKQNENNFMYDIWMQFRVFDTYISGYQIRITTRPKILLTNFSILVLVALYVSNILIKC